MIIKSKPKVSVKPKLSVAQVRAGIAVDQKMVYGNFLRQDNTWARPLPPASDQVSMNIKAELEDMRFAAEERIKAIRWNEFCDSLCSNEL